MKILSFVVFLSFGAFAGSDISKFSGHVYKKAAYDVCLNDYDTITKTVASVEGSCWFFFSQAIKLGIASPILSRRLARRG